MWEQISANRRNSAFLIVLMAGLLFFMGFLFGEMFIGQGAGIIGLGFAFIIWIILTLVSYYSGDSIFLGMSGAREIKYQDHPVLFNIVEEMKIASGLAAMPRVFIIDDDSPNAFATGRKPEVAAVAVTSGLLQRLNRDELQGVIAHEIGHINNRDTLYMLMVGVMMGTIVLIADLGTRSMFYGGRRSRSSSRDGGEGQLVILVIALVLMIVAPIIAQLIYFAISRKREYLADASAAIYTRYPDGLASALEKISSNVPPLQRVSKATAPMYIVNPLAIKDNKLNDLTSTHPAISERVKILRSMSGATRGGGSGLNDYNEAFKRVTGQSVGVVPFTALQSAQTVERRTATAETRTTRQQVRETRDLVWKTNDYQFIMCACGVKLKIPPSLKGQAVQCPHCNKVHETAPH